MITFFLGVTLALVAAGSAVLLAPGGECGGGQLSSANVFYPAAAALRWRVLQSQRGRDGSDYGLCFEHRAHPAGGRTVFTLLPKNVGCVLGCNAGASPKLWPSGALRLTLYLVPGYAAREVQEPSEGWRKCKRARDKRSGGRPGKIQPNTKFSGSSH